MKLKCFLTITIVALSITLTLALCGEDEAVQLAAEEVPLFLQVLDPLLQPGVLLQRDLQLGPQVGDQYV